MRRFVFVIILIGLGIAIVAGLMALRSPQTPPQTPTALDLTTETPESQAVQALPTETEVACTLLDMDMDAAPDLSVALAVDAMYEQMPLFKTPVAVVVTEAKPFNVGCIEPGD